MKPLSIVAVLILAFSCGPKEKLESDYEMYSSLLASENAPERLWIINQQSGLPALGVNRNQLKQNLPDLSDESLDDFIRKSESVVELENGFSSRLNIKLIGKTELDSLFRGRSRDSWNKVREQLGPNHGITTFSRVGYNKTQTQALLYYGNSLGPEAGEGYFVLFEKKSDRWIEIARTLAWMS